MAPRRVREIDWARWVATDTATLLFVVDRGRLLLIWKKRGLGAGKINGPGGRLEPGETLEACVVREVREELGVTAVDPEKLGENRFQFADGYSIHVHVYRSTRVIGTPVETEEAIPLWVGIDEIPYDKMWEDDSLWVPLVLAGVRFSGRFVFDGDSLLDHEVEVLSSPSPGGSA